MIMEQHYAMRLTLVLSTTILVTAMLTEEKSIVAPPKTRRVPPEAIMALPSAAWAILRSFWRQPQHTPLVSSQSVGDFGSKGFPACPVKSNNPSPGTHYRCTDLLRHSCFGGVFRQI